MLVKVFSRKTGLLWDVFFTPETIPWGSFEGLGPCFTGLIPAGCECCTIDVEFKIFQEPNAITSIRYSVPPIGSVGRDIVAREMH